MPKRREEEPKIEHEGKEVEESPEQGRERETAEARARILKGYANEVEAKILSGDNSEEAWKIRETILAEGNLYTSSKLEFYPLAASLYGMDEERAWVLRDKLINKRANIYWDTGNERHFHSVEAAKSTLGIVSERANNARKKALEDGEYYDDSPYGSFRREKQRHEAARAVLFSLMGQDTEDAWQLRDEAAKNHWKDYLEGRGRGESERYKDMLKPGLLLDYITGLDSERAWQVREEYMEYLKGEMEKGEEKAKWLGRSYMEDLIETLAGIDSDRAWETREEGLKEIEALKKLEAEEKQEEGKTGRRKEYWEEQIERLKDSLAVSVMGISSPRAQEMLSLIGQTEKQWHYRTDDMLDLVLRTRDKTSQQIMEKQDLKEARSEAEGAFEEGEKE